MDTDAAIVLQTLHFVSASNSSGKTKPYIWPVLLWIDDSTLATSSLVSVITPTSAELVIRYDMQAGEDADIPTEVGELYAQIGDGFRGLILVVALWEDRDTPDGAVSAGFQAFSTELRAAIADNLQALNLASEREGAIETIKSRVQKKVHSAIENSLTWYEKFKIFLGQMNVDRNVDNVFKFFSDLVSTPLTLTLGGNQSGQSSNEYEIQGNLLVGLPEISFPPFLEFAKLHIGEPSEPRPLSITNVGTVPATVSIPLSPHAHATFMWDISGQHTINPGENLELHIRFTPVAIGLNKGELEFTSNAVGNPHVVRLSGQGVQGHPQ